MVPAPPVTGPSPAVEQQQQEMMYLASEATYIVMLGMTTTSDEQGQIINLHPGSCHTNKVRLILTWYTHF